MLRMMTSIRGLESLTSIPIMTPMGAEIEKIDRKRAIWQKVYPVRLKAPPREIAAADLWIAIPKVS